MENRDLGGKRVAILATDGFERSELHEPKRALEEAGARIFVIAPHEGAIRAMEKHEWADDLEVDVVTTEAISDDYDAIVLPGGVMSPDHLRMDPDAVRLVREMVLDGKPVAAICHGPWTLIEADVVRGRTMTSYPSLRTDLVNAGAKWIDEQVVVDRGLVTSRNPDDLAAFCSKMLEEFAKDRRPRAAAPRAQGRAPM